MLSLFSTWGLENTHTTRALPSLELSFGAESKKGFLKLCVILFLNPSNNLQCARCDAIPLNQCSKTS